MNQSLPDMTSLREEIVNTAQKAYREGMMAATTGNRHHAERYGLYHHETGRHRHH